MKKPEEDNSVVIINKLAKYHAISKLLIIISITEFSIINIQAQQTFQKTIGGDQMDGGYSVQQTVDGGYITAGNTWVKGYLVKTDSSGDVLWTKTFEPTGNGNIECYSVQQTVDGGYIIVGTASATGAVGAGGWDVYLIKTDSNGEMLWAKTFGGKGEDKGKSVQQTVDGGYIIVGTTTSFGGDIEYSYSADFDVYLIKTNSTGELSWSKTFGGPQWDEGNLVRQTTDGGYIITGQTGSFGKGGDIFLIKTNSIGSAFWTKNLGWDMKDYGLCVQQTSEGGYIITGHISYIGENDEPTPSGLGLVKTDANGEMLWWKVLKEGSYADGHSVQQTNDGGYIVTGTAGAAFKEGWSRYSVYLVKTNSDGDLLWTKTFGGKENDIGYSVQQTNDEGFIITGTTESFGNRGDVILIKTNVNGDLN